MSLNRIFIPLLCFMLIVNLISCMNGKEVTEGNNNLDQPIYENNSIRKLLKLTGEQDISYAGRFIDYNDISKKSILTIRLVYNSAKNIDHEELLRRIGNVNDEGIIKIMDAQFSLEELQNANEIITQNVKKLADKGLVHFGIDEKQNRITVTATKIEDIKNEISKLVDTSIIIFEEGFNTTLT